MAAVPPNPFIPVPGAVGGAPNPAIPPLPPPPVVGSSDPNSLKPLSRRLKRLMPACFENSILRAGAKIDPERLLATSDGEIEVLRLATSDRLTYADFIMIPLFAEIVSLDVPLAISHFDERPGVTLSAVPGLVGDRIDAIHLKKIILVNSSLCLRLDYARTSSRSLASQLWILARARKRRTQP
jgi:hypothetical protein